MSTYKEIVTKAVIGKGKKSFANRLEIIADNSPDTVLGCWIINHHFVGNNRNGVVVVNGSFDVNVWYSYDNDTKTGVSSVKYNYQEKLNVKIKEDSTLTDNSEIIVRSLKQPTVRDANIEDGKIIINVEKELGIEIVGDTKVKVSIEEDNDDYDLIEDEISEEDISKEIDAEVKEDYLENSVNQK